METALLCMTSQFPLSWSKQLLWVEYSHNTLTSSATGLSPFQCIYGYQPPVFPTLERERLHPPLPQDLDPSSSCPPQSYWSLCLCLQPPLLPGSRISARSKGLALHPWPSSEDGVIEAGPLLHWSLWGCQDHQTGSGETQTPHPTSSTSSFHRRRSHLHGLQSPALFCVHLCHFS